MPPRRLSADARRFLANNVHSVLQLELVLLLAAADGRPWSVEEAARELRSPPAWTGTQLAELTALGVLSRDDERYRFAADGRWAAAVGEIAVVYRRRRTSIINAIFSAPDDDLRSFSDAFRLRPPDDEEEDRR